MKKLNTPEFDKLRDRATEADVYGHINDGTCGVFNLVSPVDGEHIGVIATCGGGWDHVSVSREDRCPTWHEMEYVKRLFFKEHECAMQLHPPVREYVTGEWPGRRSIYTLHLWRPTRGPKIPQPPRFMVGASSAEDREQMHKEADAYFRKYGVD